MNRHLTSFSSLVAAGAYGLTLLASQPVASADSPSGVATAPSSAVVSLASAALADGDDIRARFIVSLGSDQLLHTTSMFTVSPATAALADGDDVRARFSLSLEP